MSNDVMDQVARIIEWVTGLGFLLPFAIFLVVQLFNRGKAEQTADRRTKLPMPTDAAGSPAPQPAPGMPFGEPSWQPREAPNPPATSRPAGTSDHAQGSQWGQTFDRRDDEGLVWRSIFEDESGERLRWQSAFDAEAQQNVYGWEGTTWGSTFPPRSSEPVVYVG
jgi:hypothetical protein